MPSDGRPEPARQTVCHSPLYCHCNRCSRYQLILCAILSNMQSQLVGPDIKVTHLMIIVEYELEYEINMF